MKEKTKWTRIVFITGVVLLIIGALDPMEGSVVIATGSALTAVSTYFTKDRHWKIILASFIMIAFGVFFLWFFSSLGGFPPLSWWWAPLMIPYPAGWIMIIVVLIKRAMRKREQVVNS